MPARIQRRRTAGWRMPAGAVYVGRPTRWGNPYRPGEHHHVRAGAGDYTEEVVRDAAHAVRLYRRWLFTQARSLDLVPLLGGRDLVCWCPLDAPCHADVLLDLANRPNV